VTGRSHLADPPARLADPWPVLRTWLDEARAAGVEPALMALATVDGAARVSNRIVRVEEFASDGLLFTTHSTSRKGRDLATTREASGVLFWPQLARQVVVAGPVTRVPDAESDAIWAGRPVVAQAMSAASEQSEPLRDRDELLAAARRLAAPGEPLPRPARFAGYRLRPASIEFWAASPDRLHARVAYTAGAAGWTEQHLQP